MGVFVPLILGGLAFIGLPWLIHRIRRPTRNTVPFSSLMFVPKSSPPVRERKKIEHPWLMLARMLMLLILALAFARPYMLRPAAAADSDRTLGQHVILVDTSLSTQAGNGFETVRSAALASLAEIPANDRVAVVAFGEMPAVVAPLQTEGDPQSGSHVRARDAIEGLVPGFGGTRFIPALQLAEELLRPDDDAASGEEDEIERVIHLVSDLQRTGMPEGAPRYSLARGISLRLAPTLTGVDTNMSVEAVALEQRTPGELSARIRLRNFGRDPLDAALNVLVDGVLRAESPVSLPAESNTVVSTTFEGAPDAVTAGEVRLVGADGLAADNSRYFVHVPDPMREIGLVVEGGATASPALRFLDAAIADSQPLPWKLTPLTTDAIVSAAEGALPSVLILPGTSDVPDALSAALVGHVEKGGRLLVLPSVRGVPDSITTRLITPLGVTIGPVWQEQANPETFALMSWIDFDHPVFQSFRAAAYSDFSMVRFYNYFTLSVATDAAVQVIARLGADATREGDPAALYSPFREGMLALWAFPLEPEWTNLTRTRRFIPMLHETVSVLLPALPEQRNPLVGEKALRPPVLASVEGDVDWQYFGDDSNTAEGGDQFARPGLVRWAAADSSGGIALEAVNLVADESDLRAYAPEEFLLRIGAASENLTQAAAVAPETQQDVVHWEYGYFVLLALAAAGLMESALSMHYGTSTPKEGPSS